VHGDAPRSSEQWTHLLSISDQFEMEKVHKRAIRELESMKLDPVDRIVLAMEHNVPEWLDPAYVELCEREDPLHEGEAERVGLNVTVKLSWAREMIWSSKKVEPQSFCCQRCKRETKPPFRCLYCCHDSITPSEGSSAAQAFVDADIGKVIADIFHPVTHPDKDATDTSTPAVLPGHSDCPPAVPDESKQSGKKVGAKKKGKK